jgi:hypothetical protein
MELMREKTLDTYRVKAKMMTGQVASHFNQVSAPYNTEKPWYNTMQPQYNPT